MDKRCNEQRISFGKDQMTERIIIAGSGGQGIMLLGKVLAESAMRDNKYVTWFPSYGAEVRGGTAYCMVIISDQEISSPYIKKADTLIVMNAPSLKRFQERIKNNGLLIVNSSLAKEIIKIKDIEQFNCRFTDIALKLGNIKVANMVAVGFYAGKKGIIDVNKVLQAIEEMAPRGRKDLIEVNQRALNEGIKLA